MSEPAIAMPVKFLPPFCDPVKAAEAQILSRKAIREKKEREEREKREREDRIAALERGHAPAKLQAQIERLENHLTRIDKLLDETKDNEAIRNLSMARDRLFEAWRTLSGIGKPAPVRSTKKQNRTPIDPFADSSPQLVVVSPLWIDPIYRL